MTDQEKTELKISILKDIRQCCHFNFAAMGQTIDIDELDKLIEKYEFYKYYQERGKMKIRVSYFYQIRNFKPNMIPMSTAISDPS